MRVSLALLILAAIGLGAGIGWWVHPGAGIALTSLVVGVLALFREVGDRPQKGQP